MIFDKYPYSNFHELNDDWIIKTLREFDAKLDEFVALNSLTYADPILYAIETSYPANTVVIHNDTAYVSLKPVPEGIIPANDNTAEYWLAIFPFGAMIEALVNSNVEVLEGHIDEVMPSLVNAWLVAHPTATTTVNPNSITYWKLHTSLQDILLDGYITDDEIAKTIENSEFEQGNISYATGEEIPATSTCRTNFITFGDNVVKFGTLDGYIVTIYEYADNGDYLDKHYTASGAASGAQVSAFLAASDHKYRVTIAVINGTLDPADIPFGAFMYQEYFSKYVTDNKLTLDFLTYTAIEPIALSDGYIKTVAVSNPVDLTVLTDSTTVCVAVPCVAGECFNIKGTPVNVSTKRPIMFVSTENECYQIYTQNVVFSEEVVAPITGTLVINLSKAADYRVYRNKIDLAVWQQATLNGLTGVIPKNYLRALATGTSEANKAYSLASPQGAAANNFTTDKYNVTPGEILIATGSMPSSASYRLALFYDADDTFIGFHNRVDNQYDYVSEPVICPPHCAYVRFSHSTSNQMLVYRTYTDVSTRKRVTRSGDLIKVSDGTYTLWMSKHGNNNLMDLQYIRKGSTNLHTTGTDWQGPYIVAANQNADGDAIAQGQTYTGGNHAYNYAGNDGTPTARTLSFRVIADGIELEDGGEIEWNDYVEISWINRVQAWNTKKADGTGREVLEENPVWTFRPHGKVEVQNTVKALEPITVSTYYGMQMTASWLSDGLFIPNATRQIVSATNIFNTYGGEFDGSVINGYDTNIIVGMSIDTAFDLGTGSCLGSAKQIHVTAGKVYFRTVNNTVFTTGDYFAYRGCYSFIKP